MAYNKADIEKIIQLVNEGDIESLKASEFEQFQYQGFDPYKIVQSIMQVKTAKNIPDDSFKKDIFTMVAVGMIKGSVNEHNINKMSDAGKTDLRDLISRYGIKMGGGRGQPAGVITFPRVMATFPDVAIRLVKIIGPKEFQGGPMLSTRLPDYMEVQVFPAIIPLNVDSDIKRMLLTASLCYSIDQTTQISQLKDPDLKLLSATQSNFTNVGHRSPVPPADIRRSVFNSLNISNDYGKIVSVLNDYKSKIDPSFVILTEDQFKAKLL
jgi:hypothetical protein